jgi:hypothetical protein
MSLSQNGLTSSGNTTNFSVSYEDSLSNQAVVKANANALLAVIENEFNVTTGWFATPNNKFGTGNRQQVNLNLAATSSSFPGANNNGYGSAINVDAQNITGDSATAGRVEDVFMAEWSEVLMSVAGNWNAGDSSGEGLSQFTSIVRFQTGHYNYYPSFVALWLNGTGKAWSSNNSKYIPSPNAGRSDWVNQTFTGQNVSGDQVHGDGDQTSFGCALAFIYYLNIQLGFSINQIIANYNSNLASIYKKVTGDNGNPFPFFLNLISSAYPSSSTASIPGPVIDDPFPIAIVSLGGKSTFGLDEAKDIINTQGGLVSGGLWLEVQGFSKNSFNNLKVTANGNFSGSFFNLSGVQISANPEGPQFQAAVSDYTPQMIMIPFDITLSTPFLSQTAGSYTLAGALNFTDNFTNPGTPTVKQVTGGLNSMQFELLAGADPYFLNVDVKQDNKPYLSQDLRVFTATPALNGVPIVGGPALSDSIAGGYQYIKDLLTYLNATAAFTNPNGTDPFTTVFPDQYGANQTDSSVTPFTFDFGTFPFKLDNNYNFAVARVRLRGSSGTAGEAKAVRVFFRLFATQTNDTDYDINSTYRSQPDTAGKPGSPLVGSGDTTIPFFATGNFSSQQDYVSGGPNISDIEIPDHQDSVYRYYGCFLNVYDQSNIVDGKPVQALLVGTHNCLVAQIAFDDAPIPQGSSPLSWDQLAQRNLQVTLSDNPGPAETHRIPQTFDCRPSGLIVPPGGSQQPVLPDELVIDWGAIPKGSVASVYWPQVNSTDVIKLAKQFYSTNPLVASDSHTIMLNVSEGLSYIPIPGGAGENFAGLFTVDLPPGKVFTGQTYNILVRRLSSKTYTPPPPINTPPTTRSMPSQFGEELNEGKAKSKQSGKAKLELTQPTDTSQQDPYSPFSWRYAVGSFEVKIPVTSGDKILPSEENTLAIMKWRLQQTLPSNRWYPVLQRYITYCSDRVAGLGGDPNSIPPSVTGAPIKVIGGKHTTSYSGKICEIIYDCFGDFEGFILDCCCSEGRLFKSREKTLGKLALRACRDRLSLTVIVDKKVGYKICSISISC